MHRKLFLFCVLFLINIPILFGSECEPFVLQKDKLDIVLTPNTDNPLPQLYFFSNKASSGVFIEQAMNNNPGASAGWSSYLRPGHWSVLLLNKKTLTLHCSTIEPGKVVALNCAETITVCNPNYIVPRQMKGSAWLAEDKTWEALMKVIEKKGIRLNWPKKSS